MQYEVLGDVRVMRAGSPVAMPPVLGTPAPALLRGYSGGVSHWPLKAA
jgi:hypothetical protein